MATVELSIINWSSIPEAAASGNVFAASDFEFATNDVWEALVVAFADTATRIGFAGRFSIPSDYVVANQTAGLPAIVLQWTSTAITGNFIADFDYRSVGGNDAESLDQTGTQESVTVTDVAPGAANRKMEATMALTAANILAGDLLQNELFRDGVAEGGGGIAATVRLCDMLFRYNNS